MAACGFCGRALPEGATFCPACGAGVAGGSGTTPLGASASVSYAPRYRGEALPAVVSLATRDADRRGVDRVRVAAVLGVVAGLLGILGLIFNPARQLLTLSTNSSGGQVLTVGTPTLGIATLVVGVAVGVAELLFFRGAYRTLREHDRRFATPASLVLLALVGLAIVFVGLALLLESLDLVLACAGAGNAIPASCVPASTLLGELGLVLAGLVCALVGYVGLLVGIWRLGSRFSNGTFKLAAVLLIFPYLSLVGAILLLVAATNVRRSLDTMGALPTGSFPGAG